MKSYGWWLLWVKTYLNFHGYFVSKKIVTEMRMPTISKHWTTPIPTQIKLQPFLIQQIVCKKTKSLNYILFMQLTLSRIRM